MEANEVTSIAFLALRCKVISLYIYTTRTHNISNAIYSLVRLILVQSGRVQSLAAPTRSCQQRLSCSRTSGLATACARRVSRTKLQCSGCQLLPAFELQIRSLGRYCCRWWHCRRYRGRESDGDQRIRRSALLRHGQWSESRVGTRSKILTECCRENLWNRLRRPSFATGLLTYCPIESCCRYCRRRHRRLISTHWTASSAPMTHRGARWEHHGGRWEANCCRS